MSNRDSVTLRSVARAYLQRRWQPIPIPHGEKAPRLKGWQDLHLSECDVDSHFRSTGNIGILLGQASGDLVDVDLDAPQALVVANLLLPTTVCIHGRKTKLASHRWFKSPGLHQPKKFTDTDGTCLVEIRSNGQQTLVPPSAHPTGEKLCWEREGDPALLEHTELSRAVARVASASLVARHWPKRGARHEASLALHGFLLRSNFTEEEAMCFVGAVARAAGDEEWASRSVDAHTTAQRISNGGMATGRSRLTKLLGKEVVDLVSNWLGIESIEIVGETHGLNRTDVGNARRFVLIHGCDIRFCHSRRKWLIYDGRTWIEDDTGEVRRRAKQTVQSMLSEAAAELETKNVKSSWRGKRRVNLRTGSKPWFPWRNRKLAFLSESRISIVTPCYQLSERHFRSWKW